MLSDSVEGNDLMVGILQSQVKVEAVHIKSLEAGLKELKKEKEALGKGKSEKA